LTTKKEERIHF